MQQAIPMFDEVVAAFKVRLAAAVTQMRAASSAADFTGAERELHGLAQELASEMTQRILQELSDEASRKQSAFARARRNAASKGIELRVERKRKTEIRTLGGRVVEVVTPYASARPRGGGTRETRGPQGTGVYPVLDQLGIVGRSTPALRLLVSRTVCEANSVTSARELLAAQRVEIDHKAALRLTYLVADDALRARREAMRATTCGDDAGEFAGRHVVVTVDGGRVNIRRRVAGRPKKGGRKRFVTEWREPKLLTLYVVDDEGKRDRTVAPVIDGTLGDADAVFELIAFHLLRMGAHAARHVTFAGDGAPWIWARTAGLRKTLGLTEEKFTEVVDWYHVVERLSELASKQARWSDEERETWLSEQKERLAEGDVEAVETALRALLVRRKAALKTEMAYWDRNRERLRYGAFRDAGCPIGSGAVESSVRRVVNLRLKGASITWTEEHAEGVLHLRAHAKSGRWAELEHAVLTTTGWRPSSRVVSDAA
jgi:hypothetical protein